MQFRWLCTAVGVTVLLANAGCISPSLGESWKTLRPSGNAQNAQSCLAAGETLEQGGHKAEAIAKYEQARQLDPTLRAASQHLALLYDRDGKDQLALAEYQRLLKETPDDSQVLNDLGVFHYDRGNWTEAETCFRKALQGDSRNQRAWVNLGRALGQQGKYQDSYAAFARVVRAAEAHSNVAVLMAHNGQCELARKEVAEALTLDPQIQQARVVLDALNRASGNEIAQAPGHQ